YRRRLEAELARRATRDQLTGVYNRHHFELVLEQEMERSRRYGGPFALVMFDIDHFKAVNDWYGHTVGDEVLIELTRLIQESLRKSDILARWGGEEFMVLLPETSREGAETVAEQLRAKVAQTQFPGAGGITLSAGIAEYRAVETQKVLTKRADEALYRAKELGRNRLVVAP
ncbi:MAG: GGDEF domain-containing protein, partial [Thiohalorhabdaceae bacterium]